MVASLIVHVVVLTLLGVMIVATDRPPRPIPLVMTPAVEERGDFDPLPTIVVDMPEFPDVAALPDVPVEEVDDTLMIETVGVEIEVAPDDPFAGGVESIEGLLSSLAVPGSGGGAGGLAGGFGGAIGRRLARAGAQTGAIQVSLSWENFNDIDLHVVTPRGERIYFGQRRSSCGGHLDVDMNAGGPATREPVENVYWPRQSAPVGEFEIFVHHYDRHDSVDATDFQVHLLVDGRKEVFRGTVSSGDPLVRVATFRRTASQARPSPDEFVE